MLAVSVPHEPPPPVRPSLLFWKRDIGLLINITTSKSWHRALFFFFVSAVSDRFFAVKMFVQGIRVRHAWAFCQVISLRVSCMQLSKNGQVHPRLLKGWSARFSSPSSMMVAGSRSFLDFSGWSYWIFVDLRPRCILQFFYEAKSVANDVFWNSRPTQDFLRTSGKDKSLRELWGNRSDDIVHDGCGKPCSFISHWKWILYAMRVFTSNWKWTRISSMCPELFSINGDILSSLLVLMPTLLWASSRALGPWFQRVLSTSERRSLQRWEHQFVPSLYTSLPFGVCAHIFRKRLFDDLGDAHSRPLKVWSRAAFSCMVIH